MVKRVTEKERRFCLREKGRMKREYVVIGEVFWEKIRVVKNRNQIILVKVIKENKMCFYEYQGKGDYGEEIRFNKCRGL